MTRVYIRKSKENNSILLNEENISSILSKYLNIKQQKYQKEQYEEGGDQNFK